MSTYPISFDATFPGYPYVDEQDFVDASSANAWVSSLQALENTIGYGLNGTAASPLYSVAYATTYTTVTARIAALELTVATGLKLNSSNTNIQSVGVANLAGSTGLAADAGHVHQGPTSGVTSIGMVMMWAGSASNLPSGWLLCNGQLISTSTYSGLWGVFGNAYPYGGAGGSFAVPNFNDRFPLGAGGGTAPTAGPTGGSTTIAANQLPAHTHPATVNEPNGGTGHLHLATLDGLNADTLAYYSAGSTLNLNPATAAPPLSQPISYSPTPSGPYNSVNRAVSGVTVTVGSNYPAGSGYLQPYQSIYFIIRAV